MKRVVAILAIACGGLDKHPSDGAILTLGDAAGGCGPAACDLVAQTGCAASEKCTFIIDQQTPLIGHVGCTQNGSMLGGTGCAFVHGGPLCAESLMTDDCMAGSFCNDAGVCELFCTDSCPPNNVCKTHDAPSVGGLCDPTCDPLTQIRVEDQAPACGAGSAIAPTTGCYSDDFQTFTCATTPLGRGLTTPLVDRAPCTAADGCAGLSNGCEPGYVPLLTDSTGSTQIDCTALCAPLDTDATRPANAPGDATALGKLPSDAAPVAGHATCTARGGENGEECRYLYRFAPQPTPLGTTLGVCFAYAHFGERACATLRAGSAGDAGSDTAPCSDPQTGSEADCFAITHGCYAQPP